MTDATLTKDPITRDYEIVWMDRSNEICRSYWNATEVDIINEAKKKMLDIGGVGQVHVFERRHLASVTLGTSVEFKR